MQPVLRGPLDGQSQDRCSLDGQLPHIGVEGLLLPIGGGGDDITGQGPRQGQALTEGIAQVNVTLPAAAPILAPLPMEHHLPPDSTQGLHKPQNTVDASGTAVVLAVKGRHDPCVLPRAVPMVEAMVALVLADHLLLHQAQCNLF